MPPLSPIPRRSFLGGALTPIGASVAARVLSPSAAAASAFDDRTGTIARKIRAVGAEIHQLFASDYGGIDEDLFICTRIAPLESLLEEFKAAIPSPARTLGDVAARAEIAFQSAEKLQFAKYDLSGLSVWNSGDIGNDLDFANLLKAVFDLIDREAQAVEPAPAPSPMLIAIGECDAARIRWATEPRMREVDEDEMNALRRDCDLAYSRAAHSPIESTTDAIALLGLMGRSVVYWRNYDPTPDGLEEGVCADGNGNVCRIDWVCFESVCRYFGGVGPVNNSTRL